MSNRVKLAWAVVVLLAVLYAAGSVRLAQEQLTAPTPGGMAGMVAVCSAAVLLYIVVSVRMGGRR